MAIATDKPWKDAGLTKAEWVKREVAKAVNAGKAWDLEIVDFSDPNRPASCLEVDFPIIPINQIAAIEGNAGKPIYQMSKWWARRRSCVFRAMLLASAIKAPDDPSEASKLVWQVYYGNHQKKKTFANLKVADIFMGGGTTIVEGARLGMQMFGNDLNPVAWFVVKNELAQVDKAEVEALLADIEAEVKPQIMPFYACDCPRGHKGKWFKLNPDSTEEENLDELMPASFDPLTLSPEDRKQYRYEGPEVIYTFWAKHGPCQVTGCGHRTPIMSSPVMAIKEISVKYWDRKCGSCDEKYHIEEREARMAPGEPLIVADTEKPYAIAELQDGRDGIVPFGATCPHCRSMESFGILGKAKKKKVALSLLVHPDWLRGEASEDKSGQPYGGSADDDAEATVRWNQARAKNCKLIEVRGKLPDEITLEDGTVMTTKSATMPSRGKFTCAVCGMQDGVSPAVEPTMKTPPVSSYAIQGYCPECDKASQPYGGRFFAKPEIKRTNCAVHEWTVRKNSDLADCWPKSNVPLGLETSERTPLHKYNYRKWTDFFNEKQLLTHSLLIRFLSEAIEKRPNCNAVDAIVGSLQLFLRSNCMFSFWHIKFDKLAPFMSNNNFHPRNTVVEVGAFAPMGYGPWPSSVAPTLNGTEWKSQPWELVPTSLLSDELTDYAGSAKSVKVGPGDPLNIAARLTCGSSTDLFSCEDGSVDLVVTDPPFGDIMQYAELSGFFYEWMAIPLRKKYPEVFVGESPPTALEAVENTHRHENSADFYMQALTGCWREANRILKPGGVLTFTFHHDKDGPWVAVLESLFEAGFYLDSAYPIRSDETKGEGSKPGTFGAQKVEYDIIHVCRKRRHSPKAISWPKLRRQVLRDVRDLKDLLEHHQEEGLPEADLQVIRRGKALEYFSQHYGSVFKDQDTPMTVLEALLGINQLLDEEAGGVKEPPPHLAEPFTRMLLRLFDAVKTMPRDQMQKFLRGTPISNSDFADRGWVVERSKVFHLVPPPELAESWINRHRKSLTSDYDQAMFLIGACYEGSGINASDTLNNANFRPHVALGSLLTWFKTHGADSETRNAASMASRLYKTWESKNKKQSAQLSLFESLGEEEDD